MRKEPIYRTPATDTTTARPRVREVFLYLPLFFAILAIYAVSFFTRVDEYLDEQFYTHNMRLARKTEGVCSNIVIIGFENSDVYNRYGKGFRVKSYGVTTRIAEHLKARYDFSLAYFDFDYSYGRDVKEDLTRMLRAVDDPRFYFPTVMKETVNEYAPWTGERAEISRIRKVFPAFEKRGRHALAVEPIELFTRKKENVGIANYALANGIYYSDQDYYRFGTMHIPGIEHLLVTRYQGASPSTERSTNRRLIMFYGDWRHYYYISASDFLEDNFVNLGKRVRYMKGELTRAERRRENGTLVGMTADAHASAIPPAEKEAPDVGTPLHFKRILENAIILVGLTDPSENADLHTTPLGTMFGITFIANAIQTELRDEFLTVIPRYAQFVGVFLFLLLYSVILIRLIAGGRSARFCVVVWLASNALLVVYNTLLFHAGYIVPMLEPFFLLTFTTVYLLSNRDAFAVASEE